MLAVDGKTLRGARGRHGGQTKLVAVFDHVEQLALSQVQVIDADEFAAVVPAVDTVVDLRGVVVIADALHCQRGHADYCTPAARTICSPSKATSRRCGGRWPGCPGPRYPDCGTAGSPPGMSAGCGR